MTGYKDWNFPAFFEAERQLEALGYEVINPAHNDGATVQEALESAGSPDQPNKMWSWYMRRDLPHVLEVDALCVLPGWQGSKGAKLEVHVAQAIGLPLMVLKDGKLIPRVTCIGISGWARSGKDTISDHMVANHGFTKMSFAAPMKDALYALNPRITVNNVKDTSLKTGVDVYGWEDLKKYGPEIRELLQRLGTEVGREMWGENFWVDMAINKIQDGSKVVFADVRFPNEADAIKALGGEVWRVERFDSGPANDHISEHALNDYKFDHLIRNYNGLESLHETVTTILTNL
jgi:head-tail adaptor